MSYNGVLIGNGVSRRKTDTINEYINNSDCWNLYGCNKIWSEFEFYKFSRIFVWDSEPIIELTNKNPKLFHELNDNRCLHFLSPDDKKKYRSMYNQNNTGCFSLDYISREMKHDTIYLLGVDSLIESNDKFVNTSNCYSYSTYNSSTKELEKNKTFDSLNQDSVYETYLWIFDNYPNIEYYVHTAGVPLKKEAASKSNVKQIY